MDKLPDQIARAAEKAVAMCEHRGGGRLHYTGASLAVVEDVPNEIHWWLSQMPPKQVKTLVENFGCYVLEVARREFGGRYLWHEGRDQPVLVVGEPAFHVAIITWDKVRERLEGDTADHLPFFYAGFAQRARQTVPGDHALYV